MRWSFLRRAWRWLGRTDVAAVLMVLVLLIVAFGSWFPQLTQDLPGDSERLARWETDVVSRYGALAGALERAGAFRIYRSPLFLALLAFMGFATLACTLQRWQAKWTQAFHLPGQLPEATLATAPFTAALVLAPEPDLPARLRGSLEDHGFRVRSVRGESNVTLRAGRHRLASLATLVDHFALLLILLGVASSGLFGWREDLTIAPRATAEIGHGSHLTLHNGGFNIERSPDGSAAAYEADVVLVDGQQEVRRRVGVNEPVAYRGVSMYLQSYRESESGYSVTFLAVHDPGYGLVIAAGVLLLLGMAVSFGLPYSAIFARVTADGSVHVAGWAERRAYNFGREFAALVEEFRQV